MRLVDTRISIFFNTHAQIWILFKTYADSLPHNICSFNKICHNIILDSNINTRQRIQFILYVPPALARIHFRTYFLLLLKCCEAHSRFHPHTTARTLSCYKKFAKRSLSIPKEIQATKNPCIRQYLYRYVRLLKKNTTN